MTRPELAGLALSWALTYALHSTALLAAAWLLARTALRRHLAAREALWKSALVGGVLTASVQVGADLEPLAGRWSLEAVAELREPEPDAPRTTPALAPEVAPGAAEVEQPARERALAARRELELERALVTQRGRRQEPAAAPSLPARARGRAAAELAPAQALDSEERARAWSGGTLLRETAPRGPVPGGAHAPPAEASPRLQPARPPTETETEEPATANAPLARPEPRPTRPSSSDAPAPPPAATLARLWPRVALGLWLVGGALGLALLAWAWARLADLAAGREPVRAGPLHDELLALCGRAGLRRAPRLALSARLASPATIGVLRPQICVPRRALDELGPEHLRALLAHELAHVARRDPQWAFLARVLERALFFQPLNRLARRELAELAEYRADDWAVRQTGRGVCLARCLAEVAGWVLERRPAVGLLPMAEQGSQLGRRIRRLLERDDAAPREERGRWLAPLAPCALAAVTLVLPHAAAGERARVAPAASEPAEPAELVELLDAPDHAPNEAPNDDTAADIEGLVALLDAEVAELLAEVDALAGAIDERALEPAFAAALSDLGARLRSLRDKKERLDRLLPAVLALTQARAAESERPGMDLGGRPREPRRDRPNLEDE